MGVTIVRAERLEGTATGMQKALRRKKHGSEINIHAMWSKELHVSTSTFLSVPSVAPEALFFRHVKLQGCLASSAMTTVSNASSSSPRQASFVISPLSCACWPRKCVINLTSLLFLKDLAVQYAR